MREGGNVLLFGTEEQRNAQLRQLNQTLLVLSLSYQMVTSARVNHVVQ